MSATFKIVIKNPPAQQKVADVKGLVLVLLRAMDYQNELTVAHIQEAYASFPADEPPTMEGLRVISNVLRRSYRASPAYVDANGNIVSDIGSNVVYAAIHEFGGQTRAHDIVARNAKALAIGTGGRFFNAADFAAKLHGSRGKYRQLKPELFIAENGIIFRKSVHHPGSDIPARQPIQRGIEDRLLDYSTSMEVAADRYLNN